MKGVALACLAGAFCAGLAGCNPSAPPPGRPGPMPSANLPPANIVAGAGARPNEDAGPGRGQAVPPAAPGTGLTGSFPAMAASGAVLRPPGAVGTGLQPPGER